MKSFKRLSILILFATNAQAGLLPSMKASGHGRILNIISASALIEEQVESEFLKEIPLRKIATPEEFGADVAFLCTPVASYITAIIFL
ncbi:MAG: hypothetical protein M3015_04440 [Bacteroidota bacterium]|nr:hypothetical protein [Bacteroidota bacterium]